MRKRLAACVLILVFLPVSCLAWDCYNYSASFTVPGTAAGTVAEQMSLILSPLRLSGTYISSRDGFDIAGHVQYADDVRTDTTYHLYGQEGLFKVESNLWNNQPLLINVPAALEFGMKLNAHMDLNFQKLALIYHWVTQDAWRETRTIIRAVMHETETDHAVTKERIMNGAEKLNELLYEDRSLRYWLYAMETLNEAGERLSPLFETIPEYLEAFIPEDGMRVAYQDGFEIWTAGDTVMYRRLNTDLEKVVEINLPGFIQGTDARFFLRNVWNDDSSTWDTTCDLSLGEGENLILSGHMENNDFSAPWPVSVPWTSDMSLSGPLLDGLPFLGTDENGLLTDRLLTDHLQLRFEGEPGRVRMYSGEALLLTLDIACERFDPDEWPYHTYGESDGLNVFSLYDTSLGSFVSDIQSTAIRGIIPWIEHLPYSTVAAVMDIITDGGVLDMLLAEPVEEEEYEEWDEDTYWAEYFGEDSENTTDTESTENTENE